MAERTNGLSGLKRVRARSWALCALAAVALLALLAAGQPDSGTGSASELEARMERVLAAVEGAGRVKVMVLEGEGGKTGVLVVAEGARDVGVRLRLQSAVCTLLNIDNEAISVVAMQDK